MKKLIINGQESEITVHHLDQKSVSFTLDGVTYNYHQIPSSSFEITLKEEVDNHCLHWHHNRGVVDGWDVTIETPPESAQGHSVEESDEEILSPMPGKILKIEVKVGDGVKPGQTLAIMEAMKMEHTIKAPRQGIVATILWNSGDRVEGGVVLMELEKKK